MSNIITQENWSSLIEQLEPVARVLKDKITSISSAVQVFREASSSRDPEERKSYIVENSIVINLDVSDENTQKGKKSEIEQIEEGLRGKRIKLKITDRGRLDFSFELKEDKSHGGKTVRFNLLVKPLFLWDHKKTFSSIDQASVTAKEFANVVNYFLEALVRCGIDHFLIHSRPAIGQQVQERYVDKIAGAVGDRPQLFGDIIARRVRERFGESGASADELGEFCKSVAEQYLSARSR